MRSFSDLYNIAKYCINVPVMPSFWKLHFLEIIFWDCRFYIVIVFTHTLKPFLIIMNDYRDKRL